MERKKAVGLIILLLFMVMFFDLKINGAEVFESYFRQMETRSMHYVNERSLMKTSNIQVKKETQLSIEDVKLEKLILKNIMGSIMITGEERENIDLEAVITVYAGQKSAAEKFLENLEIGHIRDNSQIQIIVEEKAKREPSIKGIRVDYLLKVPQAMALDLENRHGKMAVRNFNSSPVLSNQHDSLLVENIDGDPKIDVRHGELTVRNITGAARINSAYNSANLDHIESGLNLDGRYCKLELKNITGDTRINSSYGGLFLNNLDGDLNLDTRFTGISLNGVQGQITGKNEYGEIHIRGIRNNVELENRFGDINLDLETGLKDYNLDCSILHGNIRTNFEINKQEEGNRKLVNQRFGRGTVNIMVNSEYADLIINK